MTVITYFVYLSNNLLREPELWSDTGEKDKTRRVIEKRGKEPQEFKTSIGHINFVFLQERLAQYTHAHRIALHRYLPIDFR